MADTGREGSGAHGPKPAGVGEGPSSNDARSGDAAPALALARASASVPARAAKALSMGLRKSLSTLAFLLAVIVPITLLVSILDWSGFLDTLSRFLRPAMVLIGLPGEAALVLVTSMLLNIYSAIAVAGTLALDLREATILAVMCLIAHNLLVETAVMKKAGSSAVKMALLRIGGAVAAGWLYNLLLPAALSGFAFSAAGRAGPLSFPDMLLGWALSTARLSLKIAVFVFLIGAVQRLADEFRLTTALSRLFAPLMKVMGLPSNASFLWIVVNVVGYAYGAAVIVEQVESGRMKIPEGDLFNHHAAISHSLLEDTILFAFLGLPVFWLLVPRLLLAVAVVWLERLRRALFRHSFRAGTV